MRPEVVAAVRELAREGRARFRASYVAERAHVDPEIARRDLVALTRAGAVKMIFELRCPWDGATVASFREREHIPTTFASWQCQHGEEFDVTPELIWVTFSPSDDLNADVAGDVEDPPKPIEDSGGEWETASARADHGRRGRQQLAEYVGSSPDRPLTVALADNRQYFTINVMGDDYSQHASEGARTGGVAQTGSGPAAAGDSAAADRGAASAARGGRAKASKGVGERLRRAPLWAKFCAVVAILAAVVTAVLFIVGETKPATAGFVVTLLRNSGLKPHCSSSQLAGRRRRRSGGRGAPASMGDLRERRANGIEADEQWIREARALREPDCDNSSIDERIARKERDVARMRQRL